MGLIITFLVSGSIELSLSINLYNKISLNTNLYFINYIIHDLVPSVYTTNANLIDRTTMDQNYKKNDHTNYCGSDKLTERISFLQLGGIKNAKVTDVTNQTKVNDPRFPRLIVDNTRDGKTFKTIDLQIPGKENIEFETNYEFNTWKGYGICTTKILIDNTNAFVLIDKNNTCEEELNLEVTNRKFYMDCSVYFDSYRLCLDMRLLKFSSNQSHYLINYYEENKQDFSIEDMKDFCPYNYLSLDRKYSQINKNYTYSINSVTHNETPNTKYKDKFLIVNFSGIVMKPNSVKSPKEEIEIEDKYITSNQSFGIMDDSTLILDSDYFTEFYNDTFYKRSTYLNDTILHYQPESLKRKQNEYFLITDSIVPKLNVSLTVDIYRLISPKCFDNLIKSHKFYLKFLKGLRFTNSIEIVTTLIPWEIVKIFIGSYWLLLIRFMHIKDKLKFQINEKDLQSENTSKFVAKLLMVWVLSLLYYGCTYFNKEITDIIPNLQKFLDNECYNSSLINDSFKEYKILCEELLNTGSTLRDFILISIGCEVLSFFSYLILVMCNFKTFVEDFKNKILKTD